MIMPSVHYCLVVLIGTSLFEEILSHVCYRVSLLSTLGCCAGYSGSAAARREVHLCGLMKSIVLLDVIMGGMRFV